MSAFIIFLSKLRHLRAVDKTQIKIEQRKQRVDDYKRIICECKQM